MANSDANIGSEQTAAEAAAAHPMTSFLNEGYGMGQLSRGEILEGKITSITHSEILIDVGAKS